MSTAHEYAAVIRWTGAKTGSTTSYQSYSREHEFRIGTKPATRISADPHFRGDAKLYNPEELLLVALSSCHLLSYLAECALAGVHVISYEDAARGTMAMHDGKMRFVEVVLHPKVVIGKGSNLDLAKRLHDKAHSVCFIANSVNFPVRHVADVRVA